MKIQITVAGKFPAHKAPRAKNTSCKLIPNSMIDFRRSFFEIGGISRDTVKPTID